MEKLPTRNRKSFEVAKSFEVSPKSAFSSTPTKKDSPKPQENSGKDKAAMPETKPFIPKKKSIVAVDHTNIGEAHEVSMPYI